MKKCFMLQIFSLLVSFILLACGGSSSDVIVEEGAIKINVGTEPKTIDPTLNSSVDGSIYIGHAFEGLATKGKDGKITFGTAENWDISNDGLTYTFKIRDNA